MKITINILLILGLLYCTTTEAVTPPVSLPASKYLKLNANNDRGFWVIEEARDSLSDKWEVLLRLEQRWGSNYRLFWYRAYELILYYKLTDWMQKQFCICPKSLFKDLVVGAGCAQIYRIQPNTLGKFKWAGVTRTQVEADLSLSWKDWIFSQRFRQEYLKHNSPHYRSHNLFRYRLLFDTPWKWTYLKINPFMSTEFFFREDTYSRSNQKGLVGGLFEKRVRTGLNLTILSDKLTAEVWWQWRQLKQRPEARRPWFNTYQFGVNVFGTF